MFLKKVISAFDQKNKNKNSIIVKYYYNLK